MPNYVRSRVEGGTYFFTVVTYRRQSLFHLPLARRLLSQAIRAVRKDTPWRIHAIVLLPDHFHTIWELPEDDSDYSSRLGRIKKDFTKDLLKTGYTPARTTEGERRKGYRGVWQPRFWEHTIRDARDFRMHLDYIHMNPVKHKLVATPSDWPWSSFRRYVRLEQYERDWCGRIDLPGQVEYVWPDAD